MTKEHSAPPWEPTHAVRLNQCLAMERVVSPVSIYRLVGELRCLQDIDHLGNRCINMEGARSTRTSMSVSKVHSKMG